MFHNTGGGRGGGWGGGGVKISWKEEKREREPKKGNSWRIPVFSIKINVYNPAFL